MKTALVLRALSIRHKEYYAHRVDTSKPLVYEGTIEFISESGEVKFNLDSELSQKVLAVVSEAMVESTRKLANNLTAEVIAGSPLLLSNQ